MENYFLEELEVVRKLNPKAAELFLSDAIRKFALNCLIRQENRHKALLQIKDSELFETKENLKAAVNDINQLLDKLNYDFKDMQIIRFENEKLKSELTKYKP